MDDIHVWLELDTMEVSLVHRVGDYSVGTCDLDYLKKLFCTQNVVCLEGDDPERAPGKDQYRVLFVFKDIVIPDHMLDPDWIG
jgi:hypothetical protein